MKINDITAEIIDSAMKVHTALGPGLLESAYVTCLGIELRRRGLNVSAEVPVQLVYEGVEVQNVYRIDQLVEDLVVVESKCVKQLIPVHEAQVLSHIRLGNYPVGLLINFHELHLRDGLRRLVNNNHPSVPSLTPWPPRQGSFRGKISGRGG
ncbi:MAG TPA: GxxExxY protein [Gemmatimonadaceae bacterium]|nr:GxxExxY protein [Gemmatimonadaceae bacterium]